MNIEYLKNCSFVTKSSDESAAFGEALAREFGLKIESRSKVARARALAGK